MYVTICNQKQSQSSNLKVESSKELQFNELLKVWEKDDKLRFSLDRVDLWDLCPMENIKLQNGNIVGYMCSGKK